MIKNNYHIRSMQAADLSAVLLIEREQAFPWTPGMFADCLHAGYACNVLEAENKIIGFAILSLTSIEAELLNIAIVKQYRQQGYGRVLLTHLIELAKQQQAKQLFLEVRASNVAAIALYTKMQFNKVGERRNYYPGQQKFREDAIVMTLQL